MSQLKSKNISSRIKLLHIHLYGFQITRREVIYNVSAHKLPQYYEPQLELL